MTPVLALFVSDISWIRLKHKEKVPKKDNHNSGFLEGIDVVVDDVADDDNDEFDDRNDESL